MKEATQFLPKLRFPEFVNLEPWKLSKIKEFIEEYRKVSTSQDEFEILTSSKDGLVLQKDYFNNNERILNRDNIGFNIIPEGYITYRSRSDNNTFFFNQNKLGFTGIISNYYPVFKIKKGSNNFFIYSFAKYSALLGKHSVGTSQTVLSLKSLKNISIPLPAIEEQEKIAKTLTSIDELISASEQKLKLLEQQKKGLLQNLFPQNEETIPKLRFPEFKEKAEWQYTKLEDLISVHKEKVSSDTSIPIYSSTREGLKLQTDYYNNRNVINEGSYGIVPKDYFVYRHMSDDDIFKFNLNKTEGDIAVSKEYPVFRVESNLSSDFLMYLLNYGHEFRKFAIMQKKGGTRTRLYFKVLQTFSPLLPSFEEQIKIAQTLISHDELITSQMLKIQFLLKHKQGLMQQLFPNIESELKHNE
ncbi:restriction endonuclease subunit S [Pseudoduganella danionis]|uniref:restriction endonuclease subunit S n=1 Tax=Pseudoduganella danionis TaxID=1890295 RepID=UPI0035ED2377